MNENDYLDKAHNKNYNDQYVNKGLYLRAKPFIGLNIPKDPKRILIVGLALGGREEVEAMNYYFPNYEIYGIDVVKGTLNQKINAKLFYSDIAEIKADDNFFSAVMCSAVMHEVYSFAENDGLAKIKKSISEIKRVLCKGGFGTIREFLVPDSSGVSLIPKTKEALDFSNIFIPEFRKKLGYNLSNKPDVRNGRISTDLRFAYELLLHFRVCKVHFKNVSNFLDSKEIEELYLPISLSEYKKLLIGNNLEIIKVDYIDFPNYYNIIEDNFDIIDKEGKRIKNFFGFLDIVFRKK